MHETLRHALVAMFLALMLFVGVPVFALLGYDVVVVRPQLPAIRAVLATDPQDASPPPLLRELIAAAHPSMDGLLARQLAMRSRARGSNLRRIAREITWSVLLPLHFDEDERFGLFASLSFNGVDHGLDRAALREFGRPLDALTDAEAAWIVVLTKFPSACRRSPRLCDAHAATLLAKVRARSPAPD